ncbi:MAG: SDR family oxidoreductase [Actinobacteria bacterium]|nr:SDR family oxidoreductase [Actinomycetota bacterium]
MPLLEGKVSLVTGASNGIGRGIALRFAEEGAAVGVLDLDGASCERVADEIVQRGGRAVALVADVSNAGEVGSAVRTLTDTFGTPAVLVHNAAIMPPGTLDETAEEDWDHAFAVNAKGAYMTSRELIPLMRRAGGGTIIFMASVTGVIGLPGLAAYSATKGALISLTRAMAIDYAREGIRVNSVSPGTIDTPMTQNFVAEQKDPEETRKAFDEMHPVGRIGTIEEVANVFVFLASDQSSFVTGANYSVDGGLSVKGEQPRL